MFWLQGMMAGFTACYDCIKAFSETDFTEDLKKFDVPTLIIHGDDDQIVPFADSAALSAKLIPAPGSKSTKARRTGSARPSKIGSTPTCSRSSALRSAKAAFT